MILLHHERFFRDKEFSLLTLLQCSVRCCRQGPMQCQGPWWVVAVSWGSPKVSTVHRQIRLPRDCGGTNVWCYLPARGSRAPPGSMGPQPCCCQQLQMPHGAKSKVVARRGKARQAANGSSLWEGSPKVRYVLPRS